MRLKCLKRDDVLTFVRKELVVPKYTLNLKNGPPFFLPVLMKHAFKRRSVVAGVIVITILLGGNIFLTYKNSVSIDRNTAMQTRSERIKIAVSHMAIDIIHNLDLGIRSYALFTDERYLYPYYKALTSRDSIINYAETLLREERFPLDEFHLLCDSIEAYVTLNKKLKALIDEGNQSEFIRLADQDKGYHLWLQYEKLASKVNQYEDRVLLRARNDYEAALKKNYTLQIILFLICVPTLLFTTIYTFREFRLERRLREVERERIAELRRMNEQLEETVQERTREITAKNIELQQRQDEIEAQNEEMRAQNEDLARKQDEIVSQRDLLTIQNHRLAQAQEIILQQQTEIKNRNASLEIEVSRKTKELVAYNHQLEQFAFVAAHNLRGPAARILGLGNILKHAADNPEEERLIIKNIVDSTSELDDIIKDLNRILEIRTNVKASVEPVEFANEMAMIKSNLASQIRETGCSIIEDFHEAPVIVSVKAYVDSILYNLVCNALKYRSPEKSLKVTISTKRINEFIRLQVSDNGLGIDLKKHGREIFSLYKRFHEHTQGKGLGLHLVKMQAQATGGHVEVTSEPGTGSTFSVFLKDQNGAAHQRPVEPRSTRKAGSRSESADRL